LAKHLEDKFFKSILGVHFRHTRLHPIYDDIKIFREPGYGIVDDGYPSNAVFPHLVDGQVKGGSVQGMDEIRDYRVTASPPRYLVVEVA
jgi:hypothetical protein